MAQTKMALFIGTEVLVEYVKQVFSLFDVVELLLFRLLIFWFFIRGLQRVIRHL
jgi:hypothetical protein